MIKNSCKLFLFILGVWLGLTCFLDFFAVPTVFQNVSSREEAGTIGMILFHAFNKLEVLLVLGLMACAWFFKDEVRWKKTFWTTLSGLLVLVLVYTIHMSPKIIEINKEKWKLAESTPRYETLDQEHQFYHGLFRKTDSLKILALLILLGSTFKKRKGEKV